MFDGFNGTLDLLDSFLGSYAGKQFNNMPIKKYKKWARRHRLIRVKKNKSVKITHTHKTENLKSEDSLKSSCNVFCHCGMHLSEKLSRNIIMKDSNILKVIWNVDAYENHSYLDWRNHVNAKIYTHSEKINKIKSSSRWLILLVISFITLEENHFNMHTKERNPPHQFTHSKVLYFASLVPSVASNKSDKLSHKERFWKPPKKMRIRNFIM